MSQYEIDKDLYKSWFEEKTIAIESLSKDQIQERIIELSKMEFFIRREWGMLHQQYDKITGRKGIPPWLKEDRDKLIKEPNFKVNFDEPRPKKEKKEKVDILEEMGIDTNELKAQLKNKGKEAAMEAKGKPAKKGSLIDSIVASMVEKKEEVKEEKKEVVISESMAERLARIRAKKNEQWGNNPTICYLLLYNLQNTRLEYN